LFGNHRCNCWRFSQARQTSPLLNLSQAPAFEWVAMSGEMQLCLPPERAFVALPPASVA
jgi:hypothetical protein